MMNKKIWISLLLCLLLALSLMILPAAADGPDGPAPDPSLSQETSASGEGEEKSGAAFSQLPGGIGGLFNGYLQLIEGGGIVTRAFGTSVKATINGEEAVSRNFEPVSYILTFVLVAVASYLIGSVNFGIVVSKKLMKDDVRNHGSGNSGMTNVLRTYGKKAAALTLLGDAGKAAICALAGLLLAGNGCGYLALLFCMLGHAFPVFFKFKGGKCVAAMFGGMLILEPAALLLLLLVFFLIVAATKYVSLGSVISATLIPIVVNGAWQVLPWHSTSNFDYFIVAICSVLYACLVVWLHRGNLKRLYNGEERKTDFFSKKSKKEGK